jgi:hypothetical protein
MPCATPPPAVYSTPSPGPIAARTSIDASVRYESNFGDVIVDANARYDLASRGAVLPYANLIVGYDTRSGVPGIGQIFNEDALIPAAGVRAPLDKEEYAELFVQGGFSFGLHGQPSFPETRWGFDYSRDYGSSFLSPYPHANVNGVLIDYSRFAGNVIGSVDGFYDTRVTTSLRALVGAVVSFDDHRDYGNNYAEAYAGFMVPFSRELDLRVAGVEGSYLSRGIGVPRPASYSALRVTISHTSPP